MNVKNPKTLTKIKLNLNLTKETVDYLKIHAHDNGMNLKELFEMIASNPLFPN